MTWPQVALVAINAAQVIALAWVAAWQHRAATIARETRDELHELNGQTGSDLTAPVGSPVQPAPRLSEPGGKQAARPEGD